MATIRLGKRTDQRTPMIRDFVPLAGLDDIVFGSWDLFPDDAYTAAARAGVLDVGRHLEPIADTMRAVRPMTAAFDPFYVKRLDGPNVKDRSRASGRCSKGSAKTSAASATRRRSTGS